MLRRLAKRRANKIEARYWEGLRPFMEPGETGVEYIRVQGPPGLPAFAFLTDRRLLLAALSPPLHFQVARRVPLAEIRAAQVVDGTSVALLCDEGSSHGKGLLIEAGGGVPPQFVDYFMGKLEPVWTEARSRAGRAAPLLRIPPADGV